MFCGVLDLAIMVLVIGWNNDPKNPKKKCTIYIIKADSVMNAETDIVVVNV